MGKVAVFLDRDGVINKEIKHPEIVDAQGRMCSDALTPDEFQLLDGVQEAFSRMRALGLFSCIVSNQAGYAKGFLSQEMLGAIKQKTIDLVHPDSIYYCLHHEDYTGSCECKKPKKGMLLQAAKEHDLDISRSYMIGDRRIDMIAGSECKRCFLVNTRPDEDVSAEFAKLEPFLQQKTTIVRSLKEAVEMIAEEFITEAIILCAGRGVRMGDLVSEVPKPMIAFEGVPFLQFIIAHLKEQGITRFIIPIGYLGHVITNYFGDGSAFGVNIEYVQSSPEVETGGSFRRALPYVKSKRFILHYGDSYYPYDFSLMTQCFIESEKTTMFVARNRPRIEGFADKNNLIVNDALNIVGYDKKNVSGKATLLDIGIIYFMNRIEEYMAPDPFLLDQHIIPLLAEKEEVIAYLAEHDSIGMGNIEKVDRFKAWLAENPDVLAKAKALRITSS